MAQYNADIRIGVTGKAQLNQLEAQLKRTQTQLNKLNKSLQLRTRVQAIRLDTRAANTAIKQLEQRINKLGRTINVNLRVNEKEGRKSQSGGGSILAVNNPAKQLAVAKASVPVAKALTNEAQALLDAEAARARAIDKLTDNKQKEAKAQQDLNKALERQRKLQKSTDNRTAANFFGKGTTRESGLKQVQKEINSAQTSLRNLTGIQTRFKNEVVTTSREYGNLRAEIQRAEQAADQAAKKAAQRAANRKKFNKGFGTGLGIGAASGVGNIPVVNEAVTGGLVASLSGGSVAGGALGGAVAGLGVALVGVIGDVTTFNNELNLMRKALANTVSTTDELETSFSAIRGISQDFLVPIGQATQEFTKLNAAARASGFTVEEVEEVYRGLASANVALGGDAERLSGILLATQQVFSKGKVQAEELRGQIGERLAGAFAKFAESAGLSTSQLDKALERGEVSLEDFVRFAKSLLDQYEDDAKRLADEPENAAKRLKLAMDDLREAMGPIATDIGNLFIQMANTIVVQLARAFKAINQFRLDAQEGLVSQARKNVGDTATRLGEMRRNAGTGFGQSSPTEIKAQEELLATQIEQREKATKELRRLQGLSTATGQPLNKPPSVEDPKDPKGGGKSGPRDTTAQLSAQLALEKELLRIEQQRGDLSGFLGDLREQELQRKAVEAELEERLKVIQTQNITDASKALASDVARVQAQRDLQSISNATGALIMQQTEASISGAKELIEATNLVAANEARRKELLAQGINPALADQLIEIENQFAEKRKILDVDILLLENALLRVDAESEVAKKLQEQLDNLKKIRGELDKTEGEAKDKAKSDNSVRGRLGSAVDEQQQKLNELIDPVNQIVEGANAIGDAFGTAFKDIVTGSKSAEQAFADMAAKIGEHFVNMAAKMIAEYVTLILMQSILNALGGPQMGGGGSSGGGQQSAAVQAGWPGNRNYAEGGYVTGPTNALIGETAEPEYVIPASKMDGAMARYSAGQRGEAVLAGADSDSGIGETAVADAPISVNISGGITRMGDTDYIRKDELPSIINQSAKAGEAKALRRLRQSPSTRRSVGL